MPVALPTSPDHLVAVKPVAPYRAGVIPTIELHGKRYFCYGVDSKYKTLIDLAGHIEASDPDYPSAAYREFTEESLGVFDGIVGIGQVRQAKYVYDHDTVDYLVLLPPQTSIPELRQRFHQRLRDEKNPEVIDLVWLTHDQLRLLGPHQMYFRSQNLVPYLT